jgi:NADPH-dependent curcumin reductase
MINRQFRRAARPVGLPKSTDWAFGQEPVKAPNEGEVLVKVHCISLDPAMRGWMNEGKSYIPPVALGEVMRAGTAGVVVESKNARFAKGDYVVGIHGVQEYGVSDGRDLIKVDAGKAPLSSYLGGLGMTGLSAYFGLYEIGKPKEGETVLVSGAAGAVGGVVGQLAKISGCRAVGIAGGADKCAYLKELGFDEAIDYKSQDLVSEIKKACPKGVDVFFDNVGGETLDAALSRLAPHARVVICGAISQYNNTTPVKGPSNYLSLLVNRAKMEGFVVFDYRAKYAEAMAVLVAHFSEGKLKIKEHVETGLENFPDVFLKLFRGENFGKLVLKIAD